MQLTPIEKNGKNDNGKVASPPWKHSSCSTQLLLNPTALRKAKLYALLAFLSAIGLNESCSK